MTQVETDRSATWTPPRRPDWVQRINEEGSYLNIESVVPLDADSLIWHAKTNTGLDDFGSDNWREPFDILVRSLDAEAQLNLMGRLMTRSDLLMFLEAKLRIEDTYKKHPEIEDEVIEEPIYIVGQGRTGTTFMQTMLAQDPRNGTVTNWEVMFPCPPPDAATCGTDPRVARADKLITQWNRVAPEIMGMHPFEGHLPTENIHLHCISLRSISWMGLLGQVPSYAQYMMSEDPTLTYEYEKRILKLLQWKNPRAHWVLKSPAALMHMPTIQQVYPDAKFIWTHRDPVKALASVVDLIGTLYWMRTDHPFATNPMEQFTNSQMMADMMKTPIGWMEQGVLAKESVVNMLFEDFVTDPVEAIGAVYERLGIDFTEEARKAMSDYVASAMAEQRASHKYEFGSGELIKHERSLFREYQDYFGVPDEV